MFRYDSNLKPECIYVVQQDTQCGLNEQALFSTLCSLDMFRTSSVYHQERFLFKLYSQTFGMW